METKAVFSDDRGDKLEHYGVKGMKWGKHKLTSKSDIVSQLSNRANYLLESGKAHYFNRDGGRTRITRIDKHTYKKSHFDSHSNKWHDSYYTDSVLKKKVTKRIARGAKTVKRIFDAL